MKSVFVFRGDCQDGKSILRSDNVPGFQNLARRFVQQLREDLNANEIRAMAANKVACPVLQVGIKPTALCKAHLPLDAGRNRS